MDARQLVLTLRDMSHDPDAPGAQAIPAWRAEAAAYGDSRLVADIDAHDPAELVALWDRGNGYLCERCSSTDPWADSAAGCADCSQARSRWGRSI